MRIRGWMGWLLPVGGLLLVACGGGRTAPTPTVLASATATVVPTPIPLPTRTPTATPAPVGVVLAPEGAAPLWRQAAMGAIRALAATQGWKVAEVGVLEQVPTGARLVLALPPTNGLAVAQAWPGMPVVVLEPLPENAPPNLFSLDMSPYTPERLAFAAGYLAALHAPDYRVGALFLQGDDLEKRVEAFIRGVTYYCGLCRPAFPPHKSYPVWARLPPEAEPGLWQSAGQALAQEHGVNLVYVESWPAAQALLGAEAPQSWHILGVGPNPSSPGEGHLAAGVDWVGSLQALWEQGVQQGKVSSLVPPFVVQGTTPGHRHWAQQVLQCLWEGRISP
ncbi:MAG TPA: hypothetical protein G4O04_09560 [Anaerolineae bacterium]|nr:hypothetical protein [Anaerolineae bacterium]HIQ09813.1 hypothetical protein [Anaerolineaceae bacterium]